MSDLQIIPVTTRREQRIALALPWKYSGRDPLWVPPIRGQQKQLMGFASHPFYQQGDSQCFLAMRNGEPVGRVLAIINPAHNEWHKDQTGFAGFFECEDNLETSSALFAAAGDWLRERGMTVMRGPVNPSINYELGLLTDGFDTPPHFLLTHNPPYYERLWLAAGFAPVQELYSYRGWVHSLEALDKKNKFVDESIRERFGITLRELNPRKFEDDVKIFLDIYNASLGGTWGFVPMSESEIRHFARDLKMLLIPKLTLIAECEGKPIGMCFVLVDYNVAVRASDGWLLPLGWWRMLRQKKRSKRLRLVSTNVVPEFQSWGVGVTLVRGLIPPVLKTSIEEIDFSWVLESNHLSRRTLEKGGAERYKTYRVYDAAL